ncbi:TetR family transcriptional regulator [Amycolatopsis sp., V23-08]|uniref:TetR family transcriptional regulator n=1 Tax=Amycolatopsis heterodermiae TaxID=3110235 RepID=A0ABU5R2Y3_9PSEU|nr:TetR family transcriptional regulator [Amycolatopsis sp., V23-08]MEA5360572.1 TetR family transcriptional regulator [Amycolatopsis sp., V23-08]
MASGRSRNAGATRGAILSAARDRFAADGYERTTLRMVAADVGVDPAMVIRYFGSKQGLFTAAADFSLDLPDLDGVAPADLGAEILPRFLAVWDHDSTFLALLRVAMTSPEAADKLRELFAAQVVPAFAKATPDHAPERAALLGSFLLGLATTRYVLATPGIATMPPDRLAAWAAPVIREILTGPAPA